MPSVAALFAGVGGIERGLERAGFETTYLCEWWEPAREVLRHRHPGVPLAGDINDLKQLPPADIVTGGFPCTDLSQAGQTKGLDGSQSGLVRKALELVESHGATWLLLENVKNMLPLHGGQAMRAITAELDRMGFRWAYRVVDSRFTGVPQRRQRVIILASRIDDPRRVLFADDAGERPDSDYRDDAYGFYWTEGLRGLGWAKDAVPTLKGGSTIGIPSPPGIWLPGQCRGKKLVTPGIQTMERMQGFPKDWTRAAAKLVRGAGARSKLIGNAVTVGISEWIGRRLVKPGEWDDALGTPLPQGARWPMAAWGEDGHVWSVSVSMWPERRRYKHLSDLLADDFSPLSHRAAAGFLDRLERGNLKVYPPEFIADVREHIEVSRNRAA